MEKERTEMIRLRLYTGAYADIWMSIETLGTSPIYWITDHEYGSVIDISVTNWKDLRDVMDSLKIYEYEKMEENI